MTTCETLRQALMYVNRVREEAQVANAKAEDAGRAPVYSDFEMMEFRAAVHIAALKAREAGCNVDDLVGPNVGDRNSPL